MIVEDNDLNMLLFNEILEAKGYSTIHIFDYRDVLDTCGKQNLISYFSVFACLTYRAQKSYFNSNPMLFYAEFPLSRSPPSPCPVMDKRFLIADAMGTSPNLFPCPIS